MARSILQVLQLNTNCCRYYISCIRGWGFTSGLIPGSWSRDLKMAGHRSTRLSMLALIQEGILEPGERLLTFDYMVQTSTVVCCCCCFSSCMIECADLNKCMWPCTYTDTPYAQHSGWLGYVEVVTSIPG